eukprot:TRINITY_DN7040_c0_g4_i1.p1 TRINITY_DN7040_c0_g4~~TRINITY_DN7040_c0_g4_i1.p1  ORF type:complete len:498 (+),score=125.37 TRINITY_DN7040_c0_g4_i1:108-1601(+)
MSSTPVAFAATPVALNRLTSMNSMGSFGNLNVNAGVVKRLKALNRVDPASTLEELLEATLPDKQHLHGQWIAALASPEVCITSVEDVERLDNEDIATLPVPPLVRSVFRGVVARSHSQAREQQRVLDTTTARLEQYLAPLRDRNMRPPLANSVYFQDARRYRLILAREEIDVGVRICARRIETWMKGERIILVGILKGAFIFMADLCKALVRPYSVYFVEASSYKDSRAQGGMQIAAEISPTKFIDATTKAPHKIILVDELLDNGKTMQDMKQHFLSKLAATHTEKDILTVCLFSKQRQREWPEADITGIKNLPDLWLVGYGLDDRGTKRGWTELLAIPKVKIVETIEKDEVDRLLANLDDAARVMEPIRFGGFELMHSHKERYKVCGVDTNPAVAKPTFDAENPKVTSKADVERLLADMPIVKGKYEHEIRFSFIQENAHLVPEDEIFSGNHQTYAEMRCRLRKQIADTAERVGLEGPPELPCEDDAAPLPLSAPL